MIARVAAVAASGPPRHVAKEGYQINPIVATEYTQAD